jgi:hypothetical protein
MGAQSAAFDEIEGVVMGALLHQDLGVCAAEGHF